MNEQEHVIWSNIDLNIDDWREGYKEFCESNNFPCHPEDDAAVYDYMIEENAENFYTEKKNLNVEVDAPILMLTDIEKENDRYKGHIVIQTGNISDCLYNWNDCSYSKFFLNKDGDFCSVGIHGDGINHYMFRAFNKGTSEEQIQDLEEKLYHDTATPREVAKATHRLGDEIAKVYGFELPKVKSRVPEPVR